MMKIIKILPGLDDLTNLMIYIEYLPFFKKTKCSVLKCTQNEYTLFLNTWPLNELLEFLKESIISFFLLSFK